ncbi:hypothetical protein N0V88_000737 [Collariella sp. IMI 366227]|nr:hypothetical protein N0V88_000737 [Collariella sp. IMI 366227]
MNSSDIFLTTCRGEGCLHRWGDPAVACHTDCLRLVPRESRAAFFEATVYSREPQPAEDKRRHCWLRVKWSGVLCRTYRVLPPELCDSIAKECLRLFAVLHAAALWERARRFPPSPVSFSARVWVYYTWFEGVRYISSLTNRQPDDPNVKAELAFDPKPGHIDASVFLAEDYLGVTKTLIGPASEVPSTTEHRPNLWWRV